MEIMGESLRRNKCRTILFLIDIFEPEDCRLCPCVREGILEVVFRTLLSLESTFQPFRWQYCLFDSSLSPLQSEKRVQTALTELRESLPPVVEDGIEESTRRRPAEPRLKNRKGFWASDLAQLKNLSADATAFFKSACPRPGCTGAKQEPLPSEPETAPSGGRSKSTEDLLLTNIWRGLSGLTDAKYSWSHEDPSGSPGLHPRRQGDSGEEGREGQPNPAVQGLGLDYAHFLNHVVLLTAAPGVPAGKQQGAHQLGKDKGVSQEASGAVRASEKEVARGFQAVQTLFSSLRLQLCWSLSTGASAGDSEAIHCPPPSNSRNLVAKCQQLASLKAIVKRAGCRGRWSLSCMECVRRSCMEGDRASAMALAQPPTTWSGSLDAQVTSCLRHALVRPVSGLHQLACKASFFLQPQDRAEDGEQADPSPVLLCTLPPMSQAHPQPWPPKAKDGKDEKGREREIWREPKPMALPREPSIYEALSFLKAGRHKPLGALSLQLLCLERNRAHVADEPTLSFLLTTRGGKEGGSRAQDPQLSFLLFLDFLREHQLRAHVQVTAKGGSASGGLVEWYAPGIAILSIRAPSKGSASGAMPLLRGCSTAKDVPAAANAAGPVPAEARGNCPVGLATDRTVGDAGQTAPQVGGFCAEPACGPGVDVAPGQATGVPEGHCGGRGGEERGAKSNGDDREQDRAAAGDEGVPSDAEQVQGADSEAGAAGSCQSDSCGARCGPGNAAEAPAGDAATGICNGLEEGASGDQDQEEQGPLLPGNASQPDRGDASVRCSEGGTAPGKTVSVSERHTGSLQADQAVKRNVLAHMHFDELVLGGMEDTGASRREWEPEESGCGRQGGQEGDEEEEGESAGDWSPTKENPYDDAFLPGTQMSQTPARRPQSPPPAPMVLSQSGTRRRKQEGGLSGPRGACTGREAQQKVLFVEVLCKMQGPASSLLEAYKHTEGPALGAPGGPPGPEASPSERTRGGPGHPEDSPAILEDLHRSLSHMHSWLERRSAGGEQAQQPGQSGPHLPHLELEPPFCPPEQSSQRDSHQGSVPATPAVAQPKIPERQFQSKEQAAALLQAIPARLRSFMATSEMSASSLAQELVSDCAAALGFLKACGAEEGAQGDGSSVPEGHAGERGAGPVPVPETGKGAAAASGAPPGGFLGDAGVMAEVKKRLLRKKRELQDKYRGCKEEHKLSGSPSGPFTLADKVREFELQILLRMCLLSSDDPETPANQRLWKPACDLLGMLHLCREGGVYAPDLEVYAGDLLWKRYHDSFPQVLGKMYEHMTFDIPQPSAAYASPLMSPSATGVVPSSSFPAHAFDCALSMGIRTKGGTGAERTASGVPQRSQRSGDWSQGGSQGGGERSVQGASMVVATASSRGETKLLMQGASSRRMALLRQVLPGSSSQPAAAPAGPALPRSSSLVSGAEGTSASRGTPREHPRPPVKARAHSRKSSHPKHYPQSPPLKAPVHHGRASKPLKARTSHGSAAAARHEAESLRKQQQQQQQQQRRQQQERHRWGPLLLAKQGASGPGAEDVAPPGDGKRKRPEDAEAATVAGAAKKHRHEHGHTPKAGGSTNQQAAVAPGGKGAQTDIFAARAGTFLVSFLAKAQQGTGTATGAERKEKPAARASSGRTRDGTDTAASGKAAASSRGPGPGSADRKAHRGGSSPATGTKPKAEDKKKDAANGGLEVQDATPDVVVVIGLAAPGGAEETPTTELQGGHDTEEGVLVCSEPAALVAAGGGGEKGGSDGRASLPAMKSVGEKDSSAPEGKEGSQGAAREGREGVGAAEGVQRAEEEAEGVQEGGKEDEKGREEMGKKGGERRDKRKEKDKNRAKRARHKGKLRHQGRNRSQKQRPAVSDGTVLGPATGAPPEDEHEADTGQTCGIATADRLGRDKSRALLVEDEGKGPVQASGAGKGRGHGARGLSKASQLRLFSKWHAKSRQRLWKPAQMPDPKKATEVSGAASGVPQAVDSQADSKWGKAGPFAMLKGKSVPPAALETGAGEPAVDGGEDGPGRGDQGSDEGEQQGQSPPDPSEKEQKEGGARQRSRKAAKPRKRAPAKGARGKDAKVGEAQQADPVVPPGLVKPPPPSLALLLPPPASASAGPNTAAPSIFSLLGRAINTAPAPAAVGDASGSVLDPAVEKPTDSLALLSSLQALRRVAPSAAPPFRSATAVAPNAAQHQQQQEPEALGRENDPQLSLAVTVPQRSQAKPLQSVPVNTASACKEETVKGTRGPGGDSPEKGNGRRDPPRRGTVGENRGSRGGSGGKGSAARRGSGPQGGGRRSTRSTAGVPSAYLVAPATSAPGHEQPPAEELEGEGDALTAQGPTEDTPAVDETLSPEGTQPEVSQPNEGEDTAGPAAPEEAKHGPDLACELEVQRQLTPGEEAYDALRGEAKAAEAPAEAVCEGVPQVADPAPDAAPEGLPEAVVASDAARSDGAAGHEKVEQAEQVSGSQVSACLEAGASAELALGHAASLASRPTTRRHRQSMGAEVPEPQAAPRATRPRTGRTKSKEKLCINDQVEEPPQQQERPPEQQQEEGEDQQQHQQHEEEGEGEERKQQQQGEVGDRMPQQQEVAEELGGLPVGDGEQGNADTGTAPGAAVSSHSQEEKDTAQEGGCRSMHARSRTRDPPQEDHGGAAVSSQEECADAAVSSQEEHLHSSQETAGPSQGDVPEAPLGSQEGAGATPSSPEVPSSQEAFPPERKPQKAARGQREKPKGREGAEGIEQACGEQGRVGVSTRRQKQQQEEGRMGVWTRRRRQQREGRAQATAWASLRPRGGRARSAPQKGMLSGAKDGSSIRPDDEPGSLRAASGRRSKRLRADTAPSAGEQQLCSDPETEREAMEAGPIRLGESVSCSPASTAEAQDSEVAKGQSRGDPGGELGGGQGAGQWEEEGAPAPGLSAGMPEPAEEGPKAAPSGEDEGALSPGEAGPEPSGETIGGDSLLGMPWKSRVRTRATVAGTRARLAAGEAGGGDADESLGCQPMGPTAVAQGAAERLSQGPVVLGKPRKITARGAPAGGTAQQPPPDQSLAPRRKGKRARGHTPMHTAAGSQCLAPSESPWELPPKTPAGCPSDAPSEPAEYLCFTHPVSGFTGFMLALPAPGGPPPQVQWRAPEKEPLGVADAGIQNPEGVQKPESVQHPEGVQNPEVVRDPESPFAGTEHLGVQNPEGSSAGKDSRHAEREPLVSVEEFPGGGSPVPAEGEVASKAQGAACRHKGEELPAQSPAAAALAPAQGEGSPGEAGPGCDLESLELPAAESQGPVKCAPALAEVGTGQGNGNEVLRGGTEECDAVTNCPPGDCPAPFRGSEAPPGLPSETPSAAPTKTSHEPASENPPESTPQNLSGTPSGTPAEHPSHTPLEPPSDMASGRPSEAPANPPSEPESASPADPPSEPAEYLCIIDPGARLRYRGIMLALPAPNVGYSKGRLVIPPAEERAAAEGTRDLADCSAGKEAPGLVRLAEGAAGSEGCAGEEGHAQKKPGQGDPSPAAKEASPGAGTEGKDHSTEATRSEVEAKSEEAPCPGEGDAPGAREPNAPAAAAKDEVGTPVDAAKVAGFESEGGGKTLGCATPHEGGSPGGSWATEGGTEDLPAEWCSKKQGGGSIKVYARKRNWRDQGTTEGEGAATKKRRVGRAQKEPALPSSVTKKPPEEEPEAERPAAEAPGAAQADVLGNEDMLSTIDQQGALLDSVPADVASRLILIPMLDVHEACEQQEMEAAAMMEYECTQRAKAGPGCAATPGSSLDLGPCSYPMQGPREGASSLACGGTALGPGQASPREEEPQGCGPPGICLAGHGGVATGGAEGARMGPGEGGGEEAGQEDEALGMCLGSQGTEHSHTVGRPTDLTPTTAPAPGNLSPRDARRAAGTPQAHDGAGMSLPADSLDKIAGALCPSEDALGVPGHGLAASWPGESAEHGISSSADAGPARPRAEEECQSQSNRPAQSVLLHQQGHGNSARLDVEGGTQGLQRGQGGVLEAAVEAKQCAADAPLQESAAFQGLADSRQSEGGSEAQAVQAGRAAGVGNASGAEQQQGTGGKEGLLATLQHCSRDLSEEQLRILLNLATVLPAIAPQLIGVPGVPSTEPASGGPARQSSAGGGAGPAGRLSSERSEVALPPEQGPEASPVPRARIDRGSPTPCPDLATPGSGAAPRCVGDASPAESTARGKHEPLQDPLAHRMRMETPGSTERGSSASQPSPAIKARKQMTITALFKPSPKGQQRKARETPMPPT